MNIEFTRDGSTLTAVITGRIDTNSAPETEEKIMSEIKDADKLVLILRMSTTFLRPVSESCCFCIKRCSRRAG